jgi:hypothetical protein
VSATVVSLAAARRRRALPLRDRLSAQAEVRGSLVIMLERDREVAMTPAAARTFARALAQLADSAESVAPLPEPGEPESAARLALLARELDAFDRGDKRVSDLVWLLRNLTGEVRR